MPHEKIRTQTEIFAASVETVEEVFGERFENDDTRPREQIDLEDYLGVVPSNN